jgi:solute:Na+ symporter, SSS family
VLVLAFMLVYAGKWHRRSGCMTPAEWMTYRFGADASGKAVRVLFAVSGLVGMIASLGYLIRGASLFLGQAFPYPPLYTTIALLIFSTVYTMFAGFYGVVLTDLLQGSIVMLSCFIIAFVAWDKVPDAATMGAVAAQVSGNPRWMASTPDWYTQFPEGYTQYNYLLIIAAFYLLRNVLCGMGSGAENRYFGARSDRECGLQSLLQGCTVALRWPLMLGLAVLGIFLVQQWFPDQSVVARASAAIKQHYPQLSAEMWHEQTAQITHHPDQFLPSLTAELQTTLGPDWTRRLALVSPRGTLDPEQVLAAVLLSLPAGLKGALLVAMFAAMMSAKNGMVNGVGALFVKDIYQLLFRPRAGNRELIIMSYLSAVGIVGGGLWMGYSAKNINDIWGWLIMRLRASNTMTS